MNSGRPCTACDGRPLPLFPRAILLAHASAVPPPPTDVRKHPPVCGAQVRVHVAQPGRAVRRGRQQQLQVSDPISHPFPSPAPCAGVSVPTSQLWRLFHCAISPHAFSCVSARFAVTYLWVLSTSKRSYGDGENWDSGEIGENIPASGPYVIYS